MNLHPDDIKEVLEKGWGQRHPMAWKGWVRSPVPDTFTMIYAPRGKLCRRRTGSQPHCLLALRLTPWPQDENDIGIICRIIEAAIWYTASENVKILPSAADL
jgi:hypothetical protein